MPRRVFGQADSFFGNHLAGNPAQQGREQPGEIAVSIGYEEKPVALERGSSRV